MDDAEFLAERFEAHRPHLRVVAYRMLGSAHEADDAVQEAWLRLSRSDTREVENLGGWLTTVLARVCLNVLQSRKSRREEPLEAHLLGGPGAVGGLGAGEAGIAGAGPEDAAVMADSVGLALRVVFAFTVGGGTIRSIELIADPATIARLDVVLDWRQQ